MAALEIERKNDASTEHDGFLYSSEFMKLVDAIDIFIEKIPGHEAYEVKDKLAFALLELSKDTTFFVTGTSNALILNKRYATPLEYVDKMTYFFVPNTNNSGATSIQIGTLPPKTLNKVDGSVMQENDLKSKFLYTAIFIASSDSFVLLSNAAELDATLLTSDSTIDGGTY